MLALQIVRSLSRSTALNGQCCGGMEHATDLLAAPPAGFTCMPLYACSCMLVNASRHVYQRLFIPAYGQERALVVEDAVGRDVQPERLPEVVAGLEHWCAAVPSP